MGYFKVLNEEEASGTLFIVTNLSIFQPNLKVKNLDVETLVFDPMSMSQLFLKK
jgi:hypothetical protein